VNVGSDSLAEYRERAILTLVSAQSVVEGGTSSVFQFNSNRELKDANWGQEN